MRTLLLLFLAILAGPAVVRAQMVVPILDAAQLTAPKESGAARPIAPSLSAAAVDLAGEQDPSLLRHMLFGVLGGALAGAGSGLLVSHWCGTYCHGTRVEGIALHIGVSAAMGGTVGAVVYHLRR